MKLGVGGLLFCDVLWFFLRGFPSFQATCCCHLAHAKSWNKNSLFHCVLKSRTVCFEGVRGPRWSWKGKTVTSQCFQNVRKVLLRRQERLGVCEAVHLLLVHWSLGGCPHRRKKGCGSDWAGKELLPALYTEGPSSALHFIHPLTRDTPASIFVS